MKVLYFSGYPGQFAGSQRTMAVLAAALPESVERVVVFPEEGPVVQTFRAHGIRTLVVDAGRSLNRYGNVLADLTVAKQAAVFARHVLPYTWRMLRLLRAERPDVVHCNDFRGVLLAGWAARIAGIPVIWHLHGVNVLRYRRMLDRMAHWLTNHVISVADALRRGVDASIAATTIHNGINPESCSPDADVDMRVSALLAERGFDETSTMRVVAASTLIPYKGHHHLLRAIAERPELRERVALFILGHPSRYGDLLRGLCEELGITRNVYWIGWQDNAYAWMAAGDAVVLPTVLRERFVYPGGETLDLECTEGLPRVIQEAMVAGRPVIATDVAGVRELLDDGTNGIVVAPGSATALANALTRLAEAPALRASIGAAARDSVRRFSVDGYVARVLDVYRRITARS